MSDQNRRSPPRCLGWKVVAKRQAGTPCTSREWLSHRGGKRGCAPDRLRSRTAPTPSRFSRARATIPGSQYDSSKWAIRTSNRDTVRHAVEPAQVVWIIHEKLEKQLTEGTEFIYREVELPIVEVLEEMERVGIRLDQDKLAEIRTDIQSRLKSVEQRCFDLAGQVFKVGSPKDVSGFSSTISLTPKKTKTASQRTRPFSGVTERIRSRVQFLSTGCYRN